MIIDPGPIELVCNDFKTKLLNKVLNYHKNDNSTPAINKCESKNESDTTNTNVTISESSGSTSNQMKA